MLPAAAIAALLATVPARADGAAARGRTIVQIADEAILYAAPGRPALGDGGRVIREHGSAWVLQRRGSWLQIPTLLHRGSSRGWIRRTAMRRLTTTRLLVRVDLSQRRVHVTHGGALLLSAPAAVGAPQSPTPTGATSISERIAVTPITGLSAQAFGPFVIALRLWQRTPSPGYPHGGMMAIHGGAGTGAASLGTASSAGCIRMLDADVRRLAQIVRAGTPVIIRP